MGSHVKTQNRGRTVLVLLFPSFPQAVGSQNSQTYGLRQGIVQLGCNTNMQRSWKHYASKEINVFEEMRVVRVGMQ